MLKSHKIEVVAAVNEVANEVVTDVPVQEGTDEVLVLILETEVNEDVLTALQNQDVQAVQMPNHLLLVLTDQDAQDANIQTSLLLSKRFVNFKTKILHRHKTWYFVYYFYAQLKSQ